MAEFVRRVYEKGKITIPKELRGLMGIEEGDYVRLKIVEVVAADKTKRRAFGPDEGFFDIASSAAPGKLNANE